MAVTSTTMNGLAKKRFGDFNKAIPEFAVMQELLPWQMRAKTGDLYEELIQVSRSHGFTFARSTRRTAYTLAAVRSLQTQPAQVQPSEIIGREQIAYGMLAAAEAQGEEAYAAAIAEALLSILEGHRFYLEYGMLYGDGGATPSTGAQPGLGTTAEAGSSTTSRTFLITAKSWAGGTWAQMENGAMDCYDPTLTTKRNGTSPFIVAGVTSSTRTISVTNATAADMNAVQAGDVFVPLGSKGETMAGIDAITTNTGTLFGLSATTYGIWNSNRKDHGAVPASILDIHKALGLPVGRGLAGDVVALTSHWTFMDLIEDTTALRRFVEDTRSDVVQGTKMLEFYGANNGKFEVRPCPMVKAGDVFLFKPKDMVRGGDSDLRKGIPGAPDPTDDFFFHLPDTAACEVRNFSSQFIIGKKPSHMAKLYNILPRSLPA